MSSRLLARQVYILTTGGGLARFLEETSKKLDQGKFDLALAPDSACLAGMSASPRTAEAADIKR